MKVYIDVTGSTYTLVGEEREGPFLLADSISNKLRVFFSENPENKILANLNLKFANGRLRGPILQDDIEHETNNSVSLNIPNLKKPNGELYGTHTWYYIDFTLGMNQGLVSDGIVQIALVITGYDENDVPISKYVVNLKQTIKRTAVFEEEDALITIYGDDPEETIISLIEVVKQLQRNLNSAGIDLQNYFTKDESDLRYVKKDDKISNSEIDSLFN